MSKNLGSTINSAIGASAISSIGPLNAGRTGTADTSVARFDNVVTIGQGVTAATTAANGTVVTISRRGLWLVEYGGQCPALGDLEVGITLDTNAAGLVADPDLAVVGAQATARLTTPAATVQTFALTAMLRIGDAVAANAALGLVRLMASNGAGAAPAAGDVTAAAFFFRVTRVSDLLAA